MAVEDEIEVIPSEWPKWVYREWCGVGLFAKDQEEADAFLNEGKEDAPKRRGRPPKE